MFRRIFSFAIFPKSVDTIVVILVIWSFVKIENRKSKSATIIINIYIYLIVSNDRVSEIDFDHFDHDHFDHDFVNWTKVTPGIINLYVSGFRYTESVSCKAIPRSYLRNTPGL